MNYIGNVRIQLFDLFFSLQILHNLSIETKV